MTRSLRRHVVPLAEVSSLCCCVASICEFGTKDNFKGVLHCEEVRNVVLPSVVVSQLRMGVEPCLQVYVVELVMMLT